MHIVGGVDYLQLSSRKGNLGYTRGK